VVGGEAMTANEFAVEIVVPTVRDFRDNRRSRRHAYLACVVAYQLKDYLNQEGVDVDAAMKTFGRSNSFEAVRAVCTGAKHKIFNGDRYPDNIPFTAGEDYDRPPALAGEMVCGLSRVGDAHGGREIAWHLGGLDIYSSVKAALKNYQFHFADLLANADFEAC